MPGKELTRPEDRFRKIPGKMIEVVDREKYTQEPLRQLAADVMQHLLAPTAGLPRTREMQVGNVEAGQIFNCAMLMRPTDKIVVETRTEVIPSFAGTPYKEDYTAVILRNQQGDEIVDEKGDPKGDSFDDYTGPLFELSGERLPKKEPENPSDYMHTHIFTLINWNARTPDGTFPSIRMTGYLEYHDAIGKRSLLAPFNEDDNAPEVNFIPSIIEFDTIDTAHAVPALIQPS